MQIDRRKIISLIVFMLFFGIGAFWTHQGQMLYRNEQRFFLSELVNGQASEIERRIARALSSTRILAQAVRMNGGYFDEFDEYAEEILRSTESVSNLQLAPGGVVTYIYPLAGNEKALGHDLLVDKDRSEEALRSIRGHHLTLAGPFELIQGGVAVVGRNPVYLPTGEGDQFWGFASALIYLENLLELSELDATGSQGYSYELSRRRPESGEREVFARSSTPLTQDTYSAPVKVPGSVWTLAMSRSTPTPKWRSRTGYTASIFGGLLMAWVAYFMLAQPERLRRVVKEKTHALERLAYHDHLTELANRRYMSEQLQRVVDEYRRHGSKAVLMYLDLDDFKKVNDSMGHEAGDALLQQVGNRLVHCVRANDLVARLGGDEFGILLIDAASVTDVSRIAEKLIDSIEQPIMLDNKTFSVSASVGITMIPGDGVDVTSILRNADMAMYSAKRMGKRHFCFYDRSLQAAAMAKMQLEDDLAIAIAEEQFTLYYQPIRRLISGELAGVEVLIRWSHPTRGLLSPDSFIKLLEENGRIVEVGYWVIEQVCKRITQAKVEGRKECRYSINLSPRQFNHPNLLDSIRAIVHRVGADPHLIEFEVTETSLLEDVVDATVTLRALRSMGITIAIDDFGTGYSSLALLKALPLDRLKIDRSFVSDLETDTGDQKIVQGLISMAHKLQLEVVAEGIETEGQLKLLKHYLCDLGQGYLYSKPKPMAGLSEVFGTEVP